MTGTGKIRRRVGEGWSGEWSRRRGLRGGEEQVKSGMRGSGRSGKEKESKRKALVILQQVIW